MINSTFAHLRRKGVTSGRLYRCNDSFIKTRVIRETQRSREAVGNSTPVSEIFRERSFGRRSLETRRGLNGPSPLDSDLIPADRRTCFRADFAMCA